MTTTGILEQLPDLSELEALRDGTQDGLDGALQQMTAEPETLLEPLLQELTPIGDQVPDLASILAPLQGQQDQLTANLPDSLDDPLEALTPLLEAAQEVLDTGALTTILEDIRAGRSINDIAKDGLLLFVDDLLGQIPNLAAEALPADMQASAEAFLNAAGGVAGGSPEQVADFLAEHVLGLPTDSLQGLAGVQAQALDAMNSISSVTSEGVPVAEEALDLLLVTVAEELQNLDPSQAGDWQALQPNLAQVQDQLNALNDTLAALPAVVYGSLGQLNLEQYKSELSQALQALSEGGGTESVPFASLESIADEIMTPLDQLADELETISPNTFASQISDSLGQMLTMLDGLAQNVQDNPVMDFFADLQQVMDAVAEALGEVQAAIETAIQTLVQVVDAVLDEFNQVKEQIEAALQTATDALDQIDIDALVQTVTAVFQEIDELLAAIPFESLKEALDQAFTVLDGLVTTLNEATQTGLAQLEELLSALDELRFEDAAEPAIDGIRSVTEVLSAIDPNLLPDAVKEPLREAIDAFEEQFDGDFEGYFQREVIDKLNTLFEEAVAAVRELVQGIQEKLDQFIQSVSDFDPAAMLQPVTDLYQQMQSAIGDLSGEQLLAPVKDLLQQVLAALEQISPEQLISPLVEAFEQEVMAPVRDFKPSELLQPLIEAFEPLTELLEKLDFTDALGEMAESATGFLGETGSSLQDAIDLSGVPGGDSVAAQVDPVLGLLDPTTSVDDWTGVMGDLLTSYRPGQFLAPIQTALAPVESLLDSAADDTLMAIFGQLQDVASATNALGEASGANPFSDQLETLAQGLDQIMPSAVSGRLDGSYGQLQAAFEQIDVGAVPEALRPQYDATQATVEALNPSVALGPLDATLAELPARVRQRATQALDLSDLREAFASTLSNLGGHLPGFLLGDLSPDAIREGLDAFSPTRLIARIDESFDRFLDSAQQFGPAIESAVDEFVEGLGDRIVALSPAAIFSRFDELFQPIRDAIAVAPQSLADMLDAAYDELLAKLDQIHPQVIGDAIQGLYDALVAKVQAIRDELLGALGQAIDQTLASLAETLEALNPEALIVSLGNLFDLLQETLANLSLTDLLEKLSTAFERLKQDLVSTLAQSAAAFDQMVEAIPV